VNINDFIQPFDELAADQWQSSSADNADITFNLLNKCIFGIWAGFSQAPVASPCRLKIIEDGVTRFQIPITQDGPADPVIFRPAMGVTENQGTLQVVLEASGGAGVIGYLTVASTLLTPLGPALVQQAVADDTAETISIAIAPTESNSLVVGLSYRISGSSPPNGVSVTLQPGGEVLTLAARQRTGPFGCELWYIHDLPAGVTGVDVTVDAGSVSVLKLNGNASEWIRMADGAVPVVNTNSGTSDSPTTNPVNQAAASTVTIAFGQWPANLYSAGPANGFTRMTQIATGICAQEGAYRVSGVQNPYSTGWTLSASAGWNCAIAAFAGE